MSYPSVSAIEYQSADAMRRAAVAIHKRLWSRRAVPQVLVANLLPSIPVEKQMADYADKTMEIMAQKPVGYLRKLTIEDIIKECSLHFSITLNEMKSNRRSRDIVKARQTAMFLAKMLTPRSLPEIGRRFGGRDHTTVLHAVRKIQNRVIDDEDLRRMIETIKHILLTRLDDHNRAIQIEECSDGL